MGTFATRDGTWWVAAVLWCGKSPVYLSQMVTRVAFQTCAFLIKDLAVAFYPRFGPRRKEWYVKSRNLKARMGFVRFHTAATGQAGYFVVSRSTCNVMSW